MSTLQNASLRPHIERLRNLGVVATVWVVFWHSRATGLAVARDAQKIDVPRWVAQIDASMHWPGLAFHVPIFFLTSGFLYFRSGLPNPAEYGRKSKDRLRTLVVPYLLWNALLLVGLTALQAIPRIAEHLVNPHTTPVHGLRDVLWRMTGDPIVFQFWFLRELIVLSALAPPIGWAVRSRAAPLWLLLAFAGFGANARIENALSAQGAFFFALGAFFALREPWGRVAPTRPALRWGAALFAASVLVAVAVRPSGVLCAVLIALQVVLGLALLFGAYDPASSFWDHPAIRAIRTHAFFVYAFHEPLQTILRKGFLLAAGTSPTAMTVQLFLLPVATIALSLLVAEILLRSAPAVYRTLTGNRDARDGKAALDDKGSDLNYRPNRTDLPVQTSE